MSEEIIKAKESIQYDYYAKKDGHVRGFTKAAWEYLPTDKFGWKLVPDEANETSDESDNSEPSTSDSGGVPEEAKSVSKDYNLGELAVVIKEIQTKAELDAFIKGDNRAGAKKIAALRVKEF